jgi:hypothetical protein
MMKLADLQLAMELQAALARLDDIAGPARLIFADREFELWADELARYVEWQRGELHRQLRKLGVEPDAGADPQVVHNEAVRQREDFGVSHQGDPSPPHRLIVNNRAEAMRLATERVLQGPLDDLAKGLIDQDRFDELARHRADQIRDLAEDILVGESLARCACGKPASTTIDGVDLCVEHAAAAPRRERPGFLRKIVG